MPSRIQDSGSYSGFYFQFCHFLHVDYLSSCLLPHSLRMTTRAQTPCLTQTNSRQEYEVRTKDFYFVRFCLSYRKIILFGSPPAGLCLCPIGYTWLKSESIVKENEINIPAQTNCDVYYRSEGGACIPLSQQISVQERSKIWGQRLLSSCHLTHLDDTNI